MSEHLKTTEAKVKALETLVRLLINNERINEFFLDNQELLQNVTPFDVFSIPYFQRENLSVEEIKDIAGKLVNILRKGLLNYHWQKEETSLLMFHLLNEGKAIRSKMDSLKVQVKEENYQTLLKELKDLESLNKRFLKMQNIVYPHLEKQFVNPRPLQIMWSLHDDEKELREELKQQLKNNDPGLKQVLGKYFFLVYGIIEKEELLVLPIAARVIKEETWKEMYFEALEYGFSFLEVEDELKKQEASLKEDFGNLLFNSETGGLSLEELLSVLNRLPIEFTFVDKHNQVKFYNNTKGRVFPRSPSIIGRMVNKCHPPKSVHVVEEIVEEFRAGRKDEAKFWLETKGRYLVITYYALRNTSGNYLGVLETTQDVTGIRSLNGEQRLLDWNKNEGNHN
jgi:DUF438 domain-containing protein